MNSYITWIGGKKLLREKICELIPKDIDRYVEVFGGAAWVLFNEERPKITEIYNDYDSELVNLFRCMKYHGNVVKEELKYLLNSRELFQDFMEQYQTRGMTDIQRAARFFMVIKCSFGAKLKCFGCVKRDIENMTKMFGTIQERLNNVIIENLDFEKLIEMQDKGKALFYCDPPYYNTENYYKNVKFAKEDHARLLNKLQTIKSRFIVSYNDCEFIRNLYKDFNIYEVDRFSNFTTTEEETKRYKELIITNY